MNYARRRRIGSIAGRGFDSRHLHQSFRVARLRQFQSGSGIQSGLGRFFKWLDFANPRLVSTHFAGNVSQYLDQIFLVGQIVNNLYWRSEYSASRARRKFEIRVIRSERVRARLEVQRRREAGEDSPWMEAFGEFESKIGTKRIESGNQKIDHQAKRLSTRLTGLDLHLEEPRRVSQN